MHASLDRNHHLPMFVELFTVVSLVSDRSWHGKERAGAR